MKARSIRNLNAAVYVLRHFVELSSKLLPIYESLTRDDQHSIYSEEDKKSIEVIYQSYTINPGMSEFLLGSDILSQIKTTFRQLKNRKSGSDKSAREHLEAFLEEYDRLKEDWYTTLMN